MKKQLVVLSLLIAAPFVVRAQEPAAGAAGEPAAQTQEVKKEGKGHHGKRAMKKHKMKKGAEGAGETK